LNEEHLRIVRECRRPFLPGEMTLLGKSDRKGERLRLPRLSKNRSTGIARQARQRSQALGFW
jgi:hypothetical protein